MGCLKGIGRIYHQIACDCFSSFGSAKIYANKTVATSCDFVKNHLIKRFAGVGIKRLLTDCGTEYTTWHEHAKPMHKFKKMCESMGIRHTTTKVRHPWTNGYVERLNKTILDEFYSLAFRKKRYKSIENLQVDLDKFMENYNYRRTHQGYKLKENGYSTPAEAHLSRNLKKDLTKEVKSSKIKTDIMKKKKEVIEELISENNFMQKRQTKKKVLVYQFVTTS
ncbi:MAG: integrase core domain-containing protein [bacterium]